MAIAGTNAQSVVDYLSSRGLRPQQGEKFPLYETRKKLFESAGLNSNLGDFRGAPEQNTALLNVLQAKEKSSGVSITPDNLFTIMGLNSPVAPSNTQNGTNPQPTDVNASLAALAAKAANPAIPSNLQELALQDATSKTAFPLQQESVQAQKDQLAIDAQAKKEKLIANLASRGLIFSGKKDAGLAAVDADQLSKALGVDRKFALLLAQGLDTSAQKIVKEAQKGSSDAAAALGALGYVLTPDGQLIQKPSEARAEERFALSEESALRSSRSEERAIAAAERATSAEARAQARFEQERSGVLSPQEKAQADAYLQFVTTGKDASGAPFALTNVPEKLRGNVTIKLIENQRQAATAPRDFSEGEIAQGVRIYKSQKKNLAQIIAEISADPLIKNKIQAIQMARDNY